MARPAGILRFSLSQIQGHDRALFRVFQGFLRGPGAKRGLRGLSICESEKVRICEKQAHSTHTRPTLPYGDQGDTVPTPASHRPHEKAPTISESGGRLRLRFLRGGDRRTRGRFSGGTSGLHRGLPGLLSPDESARRHSPRRRSPCRRGA